MGLPSQKCLSGVRTNGPKWHVRVGQMSGQSGCQGVVRLGKDQVHTPIGVALWCSGYASLITHTYYAHGSSPVQLRLFILFFDTMHNYRYRLIIITMSGKDFRNNNNILCSKIKAWSMQ